MQVKRYTLGLTGLEENPHGQYIEFSTLVKAELEWDRIDKKNMKHAEQIFIRQDKEIHELKAKLEALSKENESLKE